MTVGRRRTMALVIAAAVAPVAGARAQVPSDTVRAPVVVAPAPPDTGVGRDSTPAPVGTMVPRPGVFAGSDREGDLRTLQLLGLVPLQQWSVRAFGPRELARFALVDTVALPRPLRSEWCGRGCAASGVAPRFGLLPVEATTWFNSARAFGMNDGAVWAGRGLTVAATGGVHGSIGPLSVVIAPLVTWAQNRAFALDANGLPDSLRFADALFPTSIDHPQRFGDGAVARIDPGESTVRLDVAGVAAGVSTASQWWGPMTAFPYVLGNNAGGFPHAFFGTSAPVDIWVGRLHARLIYGELAQSAYSVMPADSSRRFASGVVAVFSPRGLPALEVGGARFFSSVWMDDGISGAALAKPFEGLLKISATDGTLADDVYNQIASVFARLAFPASGVEVYGEYGRDDHNADARDFWLEPDHDSGYGLGLRRAWRSGSSTFSVFTIESANFRISHLDRVRPELPPYVHTPIRQGHTHRGQPLGVGVGARSGEALVMSLRRSGAGGTAAYSLSRIGEGGLGEGTARLVRFIASAERSVYRGPFEVAGGLTLVQREGRDEVASDTNVNVSLQARWIP